MNRFEPREPVKPGDLAWVLVEWDPAWECFHYPIIRVGEFDGGLCKVHDPDTGAWIGDKDGRVWIHPSKLLKISPDADQFSKEQEREKSKSEIINDALILLGQPK